MKSMDKFYQILGAKIDQGSNGIEQENHDFWGAASATEIPRDLLRTPEK